VLASGRLETGGERHTMKERVVKQTGAQGGGEDFVSEKIELELRENTILTKNTNNQYDVFAFYTYIISITSTTLTRSTKKGAIRDFEGMG